MTQPLQLQCNGQKLIFDRPRIMGILNLTPDSFADGGRYCTKESALRRVSQMLAEGADIVDVGAESSRPFAATVSVQEELDRLLPILLAIKNEFDTVISVDTYKTEVMVEAIKAGVHMINDICALQMPRAVDLVAANKVAVCLMHMQGSPNTMQIAPAYSDVLSDVAKFLHGRATVCLAKGISADRIIIDPGFGFGKTTQHNLTLLKNLNSLSGFNFPILVGFSRKASIGELLSAPVEDRLFGSLSAHVIAYLNGAHIIRTHDIQPTVQALKIAQAVIAQD